MRRKRTIYFNDARHYYLFVFEPPMAMEDAWRPVDECAGTAVDTFIYGVARGDGLFYPSKVGLRFGSDTEQFTHVASWRVWKVMQSLIDRGLDPLKVLIDRAHEKGMDFFASLRLGEHGGMDQAMSLREGGLGWGHPELRDHMFAELEELATQYPTDGVELDFAASPGGSSHLFRDGEGQQNTTVVTDWVRKVSDMVRNRPGEPGQVGARVYPTEAMNAARGLDVRTWLKEGLVDYVVPMLYAVFILDPDMPIDWLVEAAHDADVSVYGMLQPYVRDEGTGAPERVFTTPDQARAGAANYWARGVDGLYTWFMRWPLGDAQRRTLTELGDPELIKEGDKHYTLRKQTEPGAQMGYDASLPLEIPSADPGKRYPIPFYIADDIEGSKDRIRQVQLRINISNIMSHDQVTVLLNGESLAGETCLRDYGDPYGPYSAQWLEFHLKDVRPHKGQNLLEISLDKRPEDMGAGITVEEVDVYVEYGSYPSALNWSPAP